MDKILTKSLSPNKQKVANFSIFVVLFILIFLGMLKINIGGYDWKAFRHASLLLASGQNPYGNDVYNPPWALIPLIPFAVLPTNIGLALIRTAAIIVFSFVAIRLGARRLAFVVYILSPGIFIEIDAANINWLVALGLILPPQIGLFFLMIKPQLGIPVALVILVKTWRRGGVHEVIRVFLPVNLAFIASVAVFGMCFLDGKNLVTIYWNMSPWPLTIAAGLVLLAKAIKSQSVNLAILSTPFLMPYFGSQSISFFILGLATLPLELLLASVGLWTTILINNGWIHWR